MGIGFWILLAATAALFYGAPYLAICLMILWLGGLIIVIATA
jgi:hypothetical protein